MSATAGRRHVALSCLWIFYHYSELGILVIKNDCAWRSKGMGRAFCQWHVARRVRGHDRGAIAGEHSLVVRMVTGQAHCDHLLCVLCLFQTPHTLGLATLLLSCQQGPDLVWAAMCSDSGNRSRLVQASSFAFPLVYGQAWDLSWPVRRDGKSAGKTFSPVKGGVEKSLFFLSCPLLSALGIVM